MSSPNWTVTIPVADLDDLRENLRAAQAALENEKARAAQSEFADPEGRVKVLFATLQHAVTVVQFAVANLHPLTVRGWPYVALLRLAQQIQAGIPGNLHEFPPELASAFRRLGHEAEKWEEARAEGREQELLREENQGRAVSVEKARALGLEVMEPKSYTIASLEGPLDIPDLPPSVLVLRPRRWWQFWRWFAP